MFLFAIFLSLFCSRPGHFCSFCLLSWTYFSFSDRLFLSVFFSVLDSDSDSDSDSDDEDDEDDVVVDDDDDDKDKDKVLTDDTSLSGTTLVNDDSDWMDEDTDDDVEIILGDLDTDEEMEDGEVGEEWFGNAGP